MRPGLLLLLLASLSARAFPGFNLEFGFGPSIAATRQRFAGAGADAAAGALGFTLAGDLQWRGPWSLGLRFGAESEFGMGMSRGISLIHLAPYLSRRMAEYGPFEADLAAGFGMQDLVLWTDDSFLEPEYQDPDLPPDRSFFGPMLSVTATQRIFLKVIGLALEETIDLGWHARALRIQVVFPVGWRPKGGLLP